MGRRRWQPDAPIALLDTRQAAQCIGTSPCWPSTCVPVLPRRPADAKPRCSSPAVVRLRRCPWECAQPSSKLNEYQEAVRQHASKICTTTVIDTLLSMHLRLNDNVSEGWAAARPRWAAALAPPFLKLLVSCGVLWLSCWAVPAWSRQQLRGRDRMWHSDGSPCLLTTFRPLHLPQVPKDSQAWKDTQRICNQDPNFSKLLQARGVRGGVGGGGQLGLALRGMPACSPTARHLHSACFASHVSRHSCASQPPLLSVHLAALSASLLLIHGHACRPANGHSSPAVLVPPADDPLCPTTVDAGAAGAQQSAAQGGGDGAAQEAGHQDRCVLLG